MYVINHRPTKLISQSIDMRKLKYTKSPTHHNGHRASYFSQQVQYIFYLAIPRFSKITQAKRFIKLIVRTKRMSLLCYPIYQPLCFLLQEKTLSLSCVSDVGDIKCQDTVRNQQNNIYKKEFYKFSQIVIFILFSFTSF